MRAARGFDFKPIDPKEIPATMGGHRPSRYLATLGEFMRSGAQAVEIDVPRAPSAAACLNDHIRRSGLEGQVACCQRQGRVFLVRVAP